MIHPEFQKLCEYVALYETEMCFKGRRAHRGGNVTHRVLRPPQLRTIIATACRVAVDEALRRERRKYKPENTDPTRIVCAASECDHYVANAGNSCSQRCYERIHRIAS